MLRATDGQFSLGRGRPWSVFVCPSAESLRTLCGRPPRPPRLNASCSSHREHSLNRAWRNQPGIGSAESTGSPFLPPDSAANALYSLGASAAAEAFVVFSGDKPRSHGAAPVVCFPLSGSGRRFALLRQH